MHSTLKTVNKIIKWQRNISNVSSAKLFSAENRLQTIEKFKNISFEVRPNCPLPNRKAAVLIPLCMVENELSLLFTLRTRKLKSYSGQVSFPGGMIDKNDENMIYTALRETQEELGLEAKNIDIWGIGGWFNTGIFGVRPVIGHIQHIVHLKELRINPAEVVEVFAFPLKDLCDPKNIGRTQFKPGYSVPVYMGGKLRVWGLTALMTNAFLTAFLPLNIYNGYVMHVPPVLDSDVNQ